MAIPNWKESTLRIAGDPATGRRWGIMGFGPGSVAFDPQTGEQFMGDPNTLQWEGATGQFQTYDPDPNPSFLERMWPAAVMMLGGPAITGALSGLGGMASPVSGAVRGAISSAISGGNPLTGALTGGVTGGMDFLPGFKDLPGYLQSALRGGVGSLMSGGNPIAGLLTGGLGGLGGLAASNFGMPSWLGSGLAKAGYGLYSAGRSRDEYEKRAQQMAMMRSGAFPQRRV